MNYKNFFKLATMAVLTISLFTFGTCSGDDGDDTQPQAPNTPTQAQTQFKVTPQELTFPEEGGSKNISLTIAGYKYYGVYIEEDEAEEWLQMTKKSITQCTFYAKANNTGSVRTGHIIVFVTNEEGELKSLDQTKYVRLSVSQPSGNSAPDITLDLETNEVEYDYNKHSLESVSFTTNVELAAGEYSNVSDVDWIVMYSDGWRKNKVLFDLKENTSSESRTGHITVKIEKGGKKVEKVLTVKQQGYELPPAIDVENFGCIDIYFNGCVNVTRTWLESGKVENLVHCVTYFNPVSNRYWSADDWKDNPWRQSVSSTKDGSLYFECRWDKPDGTVHFELTAEVDVNNINGIIKTLTANRQIDRDDGSFIHTMITAHNVPLNDGGKVANGSDITIVETTHDDYGMVYMNAGGRVPVDNVVNGVAEDDWYLNVQFLKKGTKY